MFSLSGPAFFFWADSDFNHTVLWQSVEYLFEMTPDDVLPVCAYRKSHSRTHARTHSHREMYMTEMMV